MNAVTALGKALKRAFEVTDGLHVTHHDEHVGGHLALNPR